MRKTIVLLVALALLTNLLIASSAHAWERVDCEDWTLDHTWTTCEDGQKVTWILKHRWCELKVLDFNEGWRTVRRYCVYSLTSSGTGIPC